MQLGQHSLEEALAKYGTCVQERLMGPESDIPKEAEEVNVTEEEVEDWTYFLRKRR